MNNSFVVQLQKKCPAVNKWLYMAFLDILSVSLGRLSCGHKQRLLLRNGLLLQVKDKSLRQRSGSIRALLFSIVLEAL